MKIPLIRRCHGFFALRLLRCTYARNTVYGRLTMQHRVFGLVCFVVGASALI